MKNTMISSNEEKECTQKILKENMPNGYFFLKNDIKDFLEGKITTEIIKEEVRILLIDMEVATSPATSLEIEQVEIDSKIMLDILGI
ncbi:MAG: hypothetical protein WC850_00385 [Candidatus Gracilibacteria bacterium]